MKENVWAALQIDPLALEALSTCELGEEIEQAILFYLLKLKDYNSHTNLVANSEIDVLLKEHVLDSLRLLPFLKESGGEKKLVDIGSGAGFPALLLAIAQPDLKVSLIESIGKKCRFLEDFIAFAGMGRRVKVHCQRAEILAHDKKMRENFDFATARAVGSLPVVAELSLPFLKTGGLFLAQRSRKQCVEELVIADAYASRLGGKLEDTIHFPQDLLGREFSLFLIRKTKSTAQIYPRSASQMKREKKR